MSVKIIYGLCLLAALLMTYVTVYKWDYRSLYPLSKAFLDRTNLRILQRTIVTNDTDLADVLHEKVRVLCWVLTTKNSIETKGKAVKETWLKRCNIKFFVSNFEDKKFPVVKVVENESRDGLSIKSLATFKYIFKHYIDKADWFLKADDDTYIIVENLRYLLAHYDANRPMYFGHHFKAHLKEGYTSGGAGYVLSREAVKRLVDGIETDRCKIKPGYGFAEDLTVGECLKNMGVKLGKSADVYDRPSFHPFKLQDHMDMNDRIKNLKDFWYFTYSKYGVKWGFDCCSELTISFHYTDPKTMYEYELLLYHIQVFGITRTFNDSLIQTLFRHNQTELASKTISEIKT